MSMERAVWNVSKTWRESVETKSEIDGVEVVETREVVKSLFVASTTVEDRDDDILDSSWVLDNYKNNPVVLWMHSRSLPPIGRADMVEVREGVLVMEVTWDTGTELGATVARQYEEKFLHAVSVGFRPGRSIQRSQLDKDDPYYKEAGWGYAFYDIELLELSAVPIPSNPQALIAKGLPVPEGNRFEVSGADLKSAIMDAMDDPDVADKLRALMEPEPEPAPDTDPDADFWDEFRKGLTEEPDEGDFFEGWDN